MINALRELADELDAVGLRAWGTGALNAGRELTSLMVAAQQRLERANDNETKTNQGLAHEHSERDVGATQRNTG